MSQQQRGEVVPAALNQRSSLREEGWPAGMRWPYRALNWERFQQHYQRLIALPRRTRRRLQRRLAMSLAALALILALTGAPAAHSMAPPWRASPPALLEATVSGDFQPRQGQRAGRLVPGDTPVRERQERSGQVRWTEPVLPGAPAATIVVDGNDPLTDCTLPDAIVSADTDTATGNCAAGSGADIIDIQVDVNLTAPAPIIYSEVTLEGNDHTISGDGTFGQLLRAWDSGDMTLNSATLTNGNTLGGGGGVQIFYGSAEINDCTFTNNYAGYGGGVANILGESVIINNSQFVNNDAYEGGAIFNFYFTNITINSSTIISNTASYRGGGVVNYVHSSMVITDSTISGNYAEERAGGLHNELMSDLLVEKSTISDNRTALYGAGIISASGGEVTINNSTISGNINTGAVGGGILLGPSYASDLTINDSTITGNTAAGPGAGLRVVNGQGELNRSLISGNTNTDSGYANEVHNSAVLVIDNHNLFGHDGLTTARAIGGFTAGVTDILATSDGTLPTPLTTILDTTLADNGGPTQTHALPNMFSPAANGALLGCAAGMLDQRGYPRGMGPGMGGPLCDIGAFELQGAPPTDVSLSGFGGEAGSGGVLSGTVAAMLATAAAAAAAYLTAIRRRGSQH